MVVRCMQAGTTDNDPRTAAAPAARSAKIEDFEFERRRSPTSLGSHADGCRRFIIPSAL